MRRVCAVFSAFAFLFGFAQAAQAQPATQPSVLPPSPLPGLIYDVPFFPGATHDESIPTPDSILGFPVGHRPARYAQIDACFKAWAKASGRARLFEHGATYEGRALFHLVISSEANIQRLDQIKGDIARLADARNTSTADSDRLAGNLPAIIWLGYTIHGDETSGSDAALALAWHLCACTDADVKKTLDELVIIIDPIMNPDGRDRYLTNLAEDRTAQPNVDDQSVLHSRPWPMGRTNHYLFDLNRDWLFAIHPETRGRLAAMTAWHPQVVVDAHEMGSQDTYLFSPPREPINANIGPMFHRWGKEFGRDQALALDRFGWRYYHGEWNEELYPGFTTTWAALRGAVGILYEQASIATDAVRRPEGTLLSYRESVHHQLVSSLANIETLRANRTAVLRDYAAQRREAIADGGPFAARTFAVVPGSNRSRHAKFLELMALHNIEVYAAKQAFKASGRDWVGRTISDRELPKGTLLIHARQPESRTACAILELETRVSDEYLAFERSEILRTGSSKLYDITGWNAMMLFGLEGYELSGGLPASAERIEALPERAVSATAPTTRPAEPVAWAFDGADDLAVVAAARLMERGVRVRATDKDAELDGQRFGRGSIVVTRIDNQVFAGDLARTVNETLAEMGASAAEVVSGYGPGDLPDMGGRHFILLDAPRIAVLSRPPFATYGFGEIWHTIDRVLGIRASYIDAAEFSSTDLRRYNVIVLPANGGDALKDRWDALRAWVRGGGTLIAIGSSAGAVASRASRIADARTLPDVLTDIEDYSMAVVREWVSRLGKVDPAQVWSHSPPPVLNYPWVVKKGGDKPSDEEAKRRDSWRQLFMPQGAILAGRVDEQHWLTAGCGPMLPVLYDGDTVLMAAGGVQAPIRFGMFVPSTPPASKPAAATKPAMDAGDKDKSKKDDDGRPPPHWAPMPPDHDMRLRMSGLLWPEAADRLASTAYVTRERVGAGQVILFASSPTFRAATRGTMRVFNNALICGPGMGTSQPIRP